MRTESTPVPTTPYVPEPPSLPDTLEPDIFRSGLVKSRSDLPAEHDATLLVAALEGIEAQRAAIEWLLDADLLCLCLV
jgi:hypothetical protein